MVCRVGIPPVPSVVLDYIRFDYILVCRRHGVIDSIRFDSIRFQAIPFDMEQEIGRKMSCVRIVHMTSSNNITHTVLSAEL